MNHDAVRRTIAMEKDDGYGGLSINAKPIEVYNGREYIIEDRLTTESGMLRLDAFDLTAIESRFAPGDSMTAARVNANLEPDEQGKFVALGWPDEGNTFVITADGGIRAISSYAVALSADPKLAQELMDELQTSVDSGGSIKL